jgi:hypothetical protein
MRAYEEPERVTDDAFMERVNRHLAAREQAGASVSMNPIEAARAGVNPVEGLNPEVLPANLWNYVVGASVGRIPEGWDSDLTMNQMLEKYGLEGWKNIAAQVGLGVIEPGVGEVGLMANKLLPLLAMTLPREVLEWMAKGTRALDASGMPVRTLHGSPAFYPRHNAEYWSPEGIYGKGHYVTEGAFVGPSHANAPTASRSAMPPTSDPFMSQMLDPQKYPASPENLELTTDFFSSKPGRVVGPSVQDAPAFSRDFAPNVRGEYLVTSRPFDMTVPAQSPREEMARIMREVTKGWTTGSRRRATEAAMRQVGEMESLLRNSPPTTNQNSGFYRPPEVTNMDLWAFAKNAISDAVGPEGSEQRVTNALRALGYDSIVSRGDAYGNPGYVGPRMWFVNDPNQIIPAGNVPEAMRKLSNAGVIDGNLPEVKDLFNYYNELGGAR